jgi:hypothetical protein
MRHRHHIIPRYDGGSDEDNNLVELSPICHSMWHYAEWLRKGDARDYCAHKMILGDVNNPTFRKMASERGIQALKKYIQTEEGKAYYSELGKRVGKLGNKAQREKFEKEGRTIAEQKWIVTTPQGETLEVSNLKKFCRENNLLPNKMCEVGKGVWKQHRGYTCKRFIHPTHQSIL